MPKEDRFWDVFISHASEDKDVFVRPLAHALRALGVSVWYDEFSLKVGDSLSKSIDRGIARSKYGLIVVSPAFIEKAWPDYELRGLITMEVGGRNVILPIWHGIGRKEVVDFSPSLADKVAFRTADSNAQDIAIQILAEVRPDLYEKHPRHELTKLASGEAIRELQNVIEGLQDQLSEYQCSYCGAPSVERINAPVDDEQKHWDMIESFECGHQTFGGSVKRPCPSDPKFPTLFDFEIKCRNGDSDDHPWRWSCYALPKTNMASLLSLNKRYGKTRDEAHASIVEEYSRMAKRWG